MARGIQIPFTLDVRQWRKGIKRVELDIEDLGDEFRDLERDADRAADDIEDSFRDIGRAAERAGDDIDQGLSGGLRDGDLKSTAGVLAGEVVDEFVENWGEAVRSGDYAGALRETFSQLGQVGGAVGGPVGAVIGGAVALGLTTAFDNAMRASENAKRIQEATKAAFGTASESTLEEDGYSSADAYLRGVNARLNEAGARREGLKEVFGVDDFTDALGLAQKEADNLGVSSQIVQDIYTGTTDQIEAAKQVLQDKQTELETEKQKLEENNQRIRGGATLYGEQIAALEEQIAQADTLIQSGDTRLSQEEEAIAALEREREEIGNIWAALENARQKGSEVKTEFQQASAAASIIASNIEAASQSAQAVKDRIAALGDKEVSVSVVAQLVADAETRAALGGSPAQYGQEWVD